MNSSFQDQGERDVTVVIPAARIPDAEMLGFWQRLFDFTHVAKLIFVANGAACDEIATTVRGAFGARRKFLVIMQSEGSAPRARNAGLAEVDTTYVHFLDDDDIVREDIYTVAVRILEAGDSKGAAVSAEVRVDGDANNSYEILKRDRDVSLADLMIDNVVGPTSCVVLKTEAVREVGGFDESMPARQDYDLWLRIAETGDLTLVSEPLLTWTENTSRPSIRNSTPISRHKDAARKLFERKKELGWSELGWVSRRRSVANHYKYLSVMSNLHNGKASWKFLLRSIYFFPQPRTVLMLFPKSFTTFARKLKNMRSGRRSDAAQYSGIERRLAAYLRKFPRAKRAMKFAYQGAFYYLKSRRRKEADVISGEIESISIPGAETAETFFGYYDRNPESERGDLIVHSHHRGLCKVNVIGADGSLRTSIETNAWNFQQGALPAWRGPDRIVFNDSHKGGLETVLLDLKTGKQARVDGSFQSVSPQSSKIASVNINLINKLRPEYGFLGRDELFSSDHDLMAIGDLNDLTGDRQFITVDDMSAVLRIALPIGQTKINHAVFSPSGAKISFLLRYFEGQVKHTRQIIYDLGAKQFHVVQCGDVISHYCWIDENELVIWGETADGKAGYFKSDDKGSIAPLAAHNPKFSGGDGHPTAVPGESFIVSDTYPDKGGMSHLYTFDLGTGENTELAAVHQPFKYRGAKRIDLHPRFSQFSQSVYFDSGHKGRRGAFRLRMADSGK